MKMHKYVIILRKRLNINILKKKKYRKVRDHCHYTGKYRGVTHSTCNLKFSMPKEITLISHNRSNYDYHFLIRARRRV